MIREARVYDKIATIENCREAVLAVANTESSRRKGLSPILRDYCDYYAKRALDRITGGLEMHPFHEFDYAEYGKLRKIEAPDTDDSIVIRAVVQQAEPLVYKRLIANSYCPVPGRGSLQMAKRACSQLRKLEYDCMLHNKRRAGSTAWHAWVLKADVRKYFASLTNEVIMESMDSVFRDKKLMDIFEAFLRGRHGIPIGAGYSAMFANAVLSPLDWAITNRKDVFGFHRYMDDSATICRSKSAAQSVWEFMEKWLNEKGLTTIGKWSKFRIIDKPLSMGGWRITTYGIYPSQNVTKHVVRLLNKGVDNLSYENMLSLASLYGYVKHSSSFGLKKRWHDAKADRIFSRIGKEKPSENQ